MASRPHGTLYIGVTSDLIKRVYQHRDGVFAGFSRKYFIKRLVFFEQTDDVNVAITREKQLKRWKREWKVDLIEQVNLSWDDLLPGLES